MQRTIHTSLSLAVVVSTSTFAVRAGAQEPPRESPTLKVDGPTAMVKGPAAPGDEPTIEAPKEKVTTVTLSAGGSWTTGNSKLMAGTLNGQAEHKFDANAIGGQILGNFGRGAPAGQAMQTSAENIQGRLRYDRYLSERFTAFLMGTGRYDRFQGLDFRLNIDPGVKYILVKEETYSFWGELGYDLQHDIRRNSARTVPINDAAGKPTFDSAGNAFVAADPNNASIAFYALDKTYTDHAARLFVGYRHAFNKAVTLQTGLEYLQSFRESTRYRINFDALLAAQLFDGFSAGMGFTARYDHAPIGDKKDLDTALIASVIYTFSDAAPPPPKEPTCPCPKADEFVPGGPPEPVTGDLPPPVPASGNPPPPPPAN